MREKMSGNVAVEVSFLKGQKSWGFERESVRVKMWGKVAEIKILDL